MAPTNPNPTPMVDLDELVVGGKVDLDMINCGHPCLSSTPTSLQASCFSGPLSFCLVKLHTDFEICLYNAILFKFALSSGADGPSSRRMVNQGVKLHTLLPSTKLPYAVIGWHSEQNQAFLSVT